MPVEPLSAAGVVMALAALIIGISKTSVGGFASLAVAVFATFLPAKESTAAVLLLLITGDVVGVIRYRRDCRWGLLRHLLPAVLPGVVLGALFMRAVDDQALRRTIGLLLTVMVGIQLWQRWRDSRARRESTLATHDATASPASPASSDATASPASPTDATASPASPASPDASVAGLPPRRLVALGYGTAAGFTTMTANSGGPVMALYLLACRVDKRAFVGTNAWFFLMVNLGKVPFSASLGLFPASTLALTVALAPFVLVGTWLGIRLVGRISQRTFETLALVGAILGALMLLR